MEHVLKPLRNLKTLAHYLERLQFQYFLYFKIIPICQNFMIESVLYILTFERSSLYHPFVAYISLNLAAITLFPRVPDKSALMMARSSPSSTAASSTRLVQRKISRGFPSHSNHFSEKRDRCNYLKLSPSAGNLA